MSYNKPKLYKNQATIETVNVDIPYYVASPTHGYEGEYIPLAGTVSNLPDVDFDTGELGPRGSTSLWVTYTTSRCQHKDTKFKRCSLLDNGVIYQNYNDRLAFLDPFSVMYYAKTGKLLK